MCTYVIILKSFLFYGNIFIIICALSLFLFSSSTVNRIVFFIFHPQWKEATKGQFLQIYRKFQSVESKQRLENMGSKSGDEDR